MDGDSRYRSYLQVMAREQVSSMMVDTPSPEADALELAFAASGRDDELNRMFSVDALTQLPDDLLLLTDKMSMAVSLECRVPLLDHNLAELASSMPGSVKVRDGQLKSVMKRALADVLPHEILHRAKRGFGTPMGAWLKKELAPVLAALLAPKVLAERGLFRPEVVGKLMEDHAAQRVDGTDALVALMNLEVWSRVYLDRREPGDVAAELQQLSALKAAA
jgi:asparagine synthase (glutamine-hydrolysing)